MRTSLIFLGSLSILTACGSEAKRPKPPTFSTATPSATATASDIPQSAPKENSPAPLGVEASKEPPAATPAATEAEVRNAEIKKALAAFQGTSEEAKGLKLYGHQWNIKPALITQEGSLTRVKGQISHAIRLTLDDQVTYEITFEGDKVQSFDIQFSDRNWIALSQVALPLVSSYVSLPFSAELLTDLTQGLDEIVYKDWKDQAKVLILKLAEASRP